MDQYGARGADDQCRWQVSTDRPNKSRSRDGRKCGSGKAKNQAGLGRCGTSVSIGTKTRYQDEQVIGHAVIVFNKVLSDAEAQVVEIPGVQVRVRLKFQFALLLTNGFGFFRDDKIESNKTR
jgi:hypothetical protein